MSKFIKITYEPTSELAAESIAAAGGRGTQDEIFAHIAECRFRQRVHIERACAHIEGMWAQGYRVADVASCPSPIA